MSPVSLLATLQEMLNPGRVVHAQGERVLLVETERHASLRTVCVTGLPADSMVIRLDGTAPQKLLRSARGENRRCDFVILFENGAKKYLVAVEIKTSEQETTREQMLQKFLGTDSILDYCESVMYRFYGLDQGFHGYERRYVAMYQAATGPKLTTRPMSNDANDRPERAMRLAVRNFTENDNTTKVPVMQLVT